MATTTRKTATKPATTRKTPAKTTAKRGTTRKATAKSGAGTAKKPATAKAARPESNAAAATGAAKSAAVASVEKSTPKPTVVTTAAPMLSVPEMKKKELIETVVKRSGIKKKDAKPVVEAMLAVLGEELARGREMNLKPLGKVKINRIKQLANGRVVMCRLRQNEPPATTGKDPLADAAE